MNEGNLFEAMRLVLPEHRTMMQQWQSERSLRNPPTLSEDEFQQMQYTWSEAIQNRSRVRVTLFGAKGDTVVEGVPMYHGRLRMATEEGVQSVAVERLVAVELV